MKVEQNYNAHIIIFSKKIQRITYLSTTTIGPFWYSKCHICTISNNLINDDNSLTEYLLCINLTGSIKSSCTD